MKEKTCCFTGHRQVAAEDRLKIERRLEKEVEWLIYQGITDFETGGAQGFDALAALTVLKLRKTYPRIRLILVLCCKEHTNGWEKEEIKIFNDILDQADEVIYTSEQYHANCIEEHNRYLVDSSAFCICYLIHPDSITAYTVEYASKQNLRIIPIFPGE